MEKKPISMKNIHQKINQAMHDIKGVEKTQSGKAPYPTVKHEDLTKVVRPVFQKLGIVYYMTDMDVTREGNNTIAKFTLRLVNVDNPQDVLDVDTLGYGIDNQDKGPGKAISYGVKYALLKLLGLSGGEDSDNENVPAKSATQRKIVDKFGSR